MKQIIFSILASLFLLSFVGCKKDNRPPLVRVNELLRKKHLPEALFIDSLFGYADVEKSIRWGEKTSYLRDKLLILSRQRELTTKEKDELRDWTSISLSMFKQAKKELKEHEKNGDKPEFLGYQYSESDSMSAETTYYFIDKDFEEVEMSKKYLVLPSK
jgi:lipoprotein